MIHPSRYFFLVVFSILPHALYVPLDVTLILLGLLVWTGAFCFKDRFAPSVWSLRGFTLLCVVFCWLRYGTLANPDAASALLCMITTLKLFETQSYRDAMALLLILLLVVMSYLIQSYSIFASGYMILAFLGVIYLLMELQRKKYFLRQNAVRWSDFFSLEMVVALPLLVALFIFFPRFTTRFGSGDRQVQTVGFSEQIELGQLIQLSQSTEVAFKLRFLNNKKVNYDNLYFRGSVLTRNKNMSWKKSTADQEFVQSYPSSAIPDYQIYLPGRQQRNLFTLDNGNVAEVTPRMMLFKKTNENIYLAATPFEQSINYTVVSNLPLPKVYKEEELSLEQPLSLELSTLAETWRASTQEDTIQNILTYFRDSGFSYSTEVPGYANLDDFMKARVGFCEHYASAFVLFARHLKIPSRIVVGFMGGEINPFDDTLTVRDRFAHAWAEVYFSDTGWTRVDPTSVIYPQRLQNTFAIAGPQQQFYENFFTTSILFLESVNNRFELLMMGFNSDSQWNIISKISNYFGVKVIVLILLLPLFFALLIGLMWWVWRLDFKEQDLLAKSYLLLQKKIERKGFRRSLSEGPLEFLSQLRTHDKLPRVYTELFAEYIELRFSAPLDKKSSERFYLKVKGTR